MKKPARPAYTFSRVMPSLVQQQQQWEQQTQQPEQQQKHRTVG